MTTTSPSNVKANGGSPGGQAGRRRPPATPKGRQLDPQALVEVHKLLESQEIRRDRLIEYLHLIQDRYGFISAAHLCALAAEMKLAQAEVYEVATFYAHFDVVKEGETPPPPVTVRVCESLSCAMAGAETTALIRLKETLGRGCASCARLHGRLRPGAGLRGRPCPGFRRHAGHGCGRGRAAEPHAQAYDTPNDFARYQAGGGYALLRDCLAGKRTREELIQMVSDAGLRGLGGAGFPTGRKWSLVRAEPAPRLFAVNADEGEPGTFKDRYYLERDPHRFLEGMLIAAWVVEAAETYIYIRDEYPEIRADARSGDRRRSSRPACRRTPSCICAAAPAPISAAKNSR